MAGHVGLAGGDGVCDVSDASDVSDVSGVGGVGGVGEASGGCSTGATSTRPLHPIGSEEALALFDPVDATILQTVVSNLRP